MRRKLPQGNAIVLAVLRSPAHRIVSGQAIELRYRGRKSGRSTSSRSSTRETATG
jgi:hypothetical protein